MATIITLGQSKKTGNPIYQAIIRRKGFKPITKCFASKTDADKWASLIEADIDSFEVCLSMDTEGIIEKYKRK